MVILTINTGSSSVRLAVFSYEKGDKERIASAYYITGENDPRVLLEAFMRNNGIKEKEISLVAHRVVHGGTNFITSCLITPEVVDEIDRLSSLAPLHNPQALAWIRTCKEICGNEIPQTAIFDTAFYAQLPDIAKTYALPKKLCELHEIRRYGFHGIAHGAMAARWQEIRSDTQGKGRLISLQLGAGCSITAVRDGQAVDTSMGFSPLEGLMMATRPGDLDPGLVSYLIGRGGLTSIELEKLLNNSSGLLGVSGVSGDMKELLASDAPDARFAVELYCYRAKKYIGAYTAALGGIDALLFGGGVGENAPVIRRKMLDGMQWCGIRIDDGSNNITIGKEGRISSRKSGVDVWVIPVDEAGLLAEEAVKVVNCL